MKNVCVEKKLLVFLVKNNWNFIFNWFFFEFENVVWGVKKREKNSLGRWYLMFILFS